MNSQVPRLCPGEFIEGLSAEAVEFLPLVPPPVFANPVIVPEEYSSLARFFLAGMS